ncbi:MAG TPA: hypothetical protein VKA18_06225, partial [Alphaproteobacteria bacterium]|nr:hypothetical protein [Alphaproteobacteria bacterium]
ERCTPTTIIVRRGKLQSAGGLISSFLGGGLTENLGRALVARAVFLLKTVDNFGISPSIGNWNPA